MRTTPQTKTSLDQIRQGADLAKKLVKALDINADHQLDIDEISRIQVRDGFVARDLLSKASSFATFGSDDSEPSLGEVGAQFDTAVRSAERADANKDGVLSADELKNASQVASLLAQFSSAHLGDSVADFQIKPFEKPGSPAWVKLAQKSYYDPKTNDYPRFGTALITPRSELPPGVRDAYDALGKQYPEGKLEASSEMVNGQEVYFMHSWSDDVVHAAIVSTDGKVLSTATARPKSAEDRWRNWSIDWK